MRLAILFSGQGNQSPELLRNLERDAPADISDVLKQLIPSVWMNSAVDHALLFENEVAQPLLFAHQMVLWKSLSERIPEPICVAGYSLGEMAACCAANVFSAIEGVELCARRARLMDSVVEESCGLVAVLGLNEERVSAVAQQSSTHIAIQNSPRHFVLGGTSKALASAASIATSLGATRVFRPQVATPSHTPLLEEAGAEFERDLVSHGIPAPLQFPVFRGIDGQRLWTARDAVIALARQLHTRLNWTECMQSVYELRPDKILEIGPGNVLTRILSELSINIPARSVSDFRAVEGVLEWIG